MGIKDKDLILREIENRECIAFVYDLLITDDDMYDNIIRCYFRRSLERPNIWSLKIIDDRTNVKSDVVYCWLYEMPKSNMPLTKVCTFGLANLQLQLKKEVQEKSLLDFTIGELLSEE